MFPLFVGTMSAYLRRVLTIDFVFFICLFIKLLIYAVKVSWIFNWYFILYPSTITLFLSHIAPSSPLGYLSCGFCGYLICSSLCVLLIIVFFLFRLHNLLQDKTPCLHGALVHFARQTVSPEVKGWLLISLTALAMLLLLEISSWRRGNKIEYAELTLRVSAFKHCISPKLNIILYSRIIVYI